MMVQHRTIICPQCKGRLRLTFRRGSSGHDFICSYCYCHVSLGFATSRGRSGAIIEKKITRRTERNGI
jgi:ribosomal protein L37AE/L43A